MRTDRPYTHTTKCTRWSGTSMMPRYQLDGKDEWVSHDRLNPVADGIVLKPPPAVFDNADFFVTKKLPDRVFYRGYPLAEPVENLVTDATPRTACRRQPWRAAWLRAVCFFAE